MKKIILFGTGGTTKLLAEKFQETNEYQIVAFCLHKKFIQHNSLNNIPIVAFEEIEQLFTPKQHYFFVAIDNNSLNELRTNIMQEFIQKGYTPATYISPSASISKNSTIGFHCCFLENVVIHSGCTIGNNVMVFPNSYLGHDTIIEDNCFISANCSLAGGCSLGKNCFMGASSAIANCIKIGNNNVIAMGSTCIKSTKDNMITIQKNIYQNAKERFILWREKVGKIFTQQN